MPQKVGQMAAPPALAKVPGADINATDRAQMDLYGRLAGLKPQEQEVSRARAMADMLRQGAGMPGMNEGGRTTQAAHPLQFLSSLAHAAGSAYKTSQADKAEDALGQSRRKALSDWRSTLGFLPNVGE